MRSAARFAAWRPVLCALATAISLLHQSASAAGRPFTVADSIAMTQLAIPSPWGVASAAQRIPMSPDGKRFVIVTRRGDFERGCNVYNLLLIEAADVSAALAQKSLVSTKTIAQFCTATNLPGIFDVRWSSDGRSLTFLGSDHERPTQLFSLDPVTRVRRQLTHHASNVIAYSANSSSRFLFAAQEPDDWSARNARGFVVGTEPFQEIVSHGALQQYDHVRYWTGTRSGEREIRLDEPIFQMYGGDYEQFPGPWLSPNGEKAILLREIPNPPLNWWTQYKAVSRLGLFRDANRKGLEDFVAGNPEFYYFVVADLKTGKTRKLLPSPAGYGFGGADLDVHWFDNNTRVILASAFLPIDAHGLPLKNDEGPSIVDLDLNAGSARAIFSVFSSARRSSIGALVGSAFNGRDLLELKMDGEDGSQDTVRLRLRGRDWQLEVKTVATADTAGVVDGFRLFVRQDLNQPPELAATQIATQRTGLITDLNPQLRTLSLGEVKTIHWKDSAGHEWSGGLIAPAGYRPGLRYGLVIQTGGYDEGTFLADGPFGLASGYALRALAGRGLFALQLSCDPEKTEPLKDLERDDMASARSCFANVIAMLAAQGLIDPKRVGMHAHSHYGFYAQDAWLYSDLHLAALSVADASEVSSFAHAAFYGAPYPGMLHIERRAAAEPWGSDVNRWAHADAGLTLARSSAPLMIQNYYYLYQWWDVFALLREHQRPVEMIDFPDGQHDLFKPWERQTSQNAVVDWFDFWLNGHEDPDPTKAAQYRRWRSMRARTNN